MTQREVIENMELLAFVSALEQICIVCNKPFGKDARQARRIARDTIA